MIVPFKNMPSDSRIWVFQGNRIMSQEECKEARAKIKDFLNIWQSHGEELKVSFSINYKLFIIVAVDEKITNASGCSTDKLVSFINKLGTDFEMDFMDRQTVAFMGETEKPQLLSLKDFKEKARHGDLSPETVIFNNTLVTLEELERGWKVPILKSWLSKYMVQVS